MVQLTEMKKRLDIVCQILTPKFDTTCLTVGQKIAAMVEAFACDIELNGLALDPTPDVVELPHQTRV